MQSVIVVGCGVIGLTCGVKLLREGFRVKIIADRMPPKTTSNKAAAIWLPYCVKPMEKAGSWAKSSYQEYLMLSKKPDFGVTFVNYLQVSKIADIPTPSWSEYAREFMRMDSGKVPSRYVSGFTSKVPFIEPSIFLNRLLTEFISLHGEVELGHFKSFSDIIDLRCDLIVNCTGLGSAELLEDSDMFPIRGQIVVVNPDRKIRHIADYSDEKNPVYVYPRHNECILGGTVDSNNWSKRVDKNSVSIIRDRCIDLEPALHGSTLRRTYVGLRPGRKRVRLEPEQFGSKLIVHNYGHGGAGFTVSWGCADEVAKIFSG